MADHNRIKLVSDGTNAGTHLVLVDHPDVVIPFVHCEISAAADQNVFVGTATFDFVMSQVEWSGKAKVGANEMQVTIKSEGLVSTARLLDANGEELRDIGTLKITVDGPDGVNEAILTKVRRHAASDAGEFGNPVSEVSAQDASPDA